MNSISLSGVLILLINSLSTLCAQKSRIVINEIHCRAAHEQDKTEFVELYNADSFAVDLSGWTLKGIQYTFPAGTILPAHKYLIVAENPTQAAKAFQLSSYVLGSYAGKLSSDGDRLELRDASGSLVDKVVYQSGFPFPLTGTTGATSLQLINPNFDNMQGGFWRSALPTPCRANASVWCETTPPIIDHVWHSPTQPTAQQSTRICANIRDAEGIARVEATYQLVLAGQYIRRNDAAFENPANWKTITLSDDGINGDSLANDGIFTGTIPAQPHRSLVRYRLTATDMQKNRVRVPFADDTQPNFAYFVYDGLPRYEGHSLDSLPALSICQLIAKQEDVNYNIFKYLGDNYKNTGTLVYGGVVYDHIGFRSRGYRNRHARTKRNLKFNFNRGHHITTYDNYGRPYAVKRGKWVLSGTWLLDNPNTHGIAESVLYKLFNLQGAPATHSDYVHLRVIDQADETANPREFWGLYLVMENFDGDFLQTHQLPNGNIYSYKPPKIRHQLPDSLYGLRNAPYMRWDTACERRNTLGWWRNHLNIKAYYGFIATQEAINNRETGYRKQHWWMEYHNPKTNQWTIFPWDMDMTWRQTTGNTTISAGIRKSAFHHAPIQIGYYNHLRNFLDLLYNEEQMNMLIQEYAQLVYTPQREFSWVDADRLRWGHRYTSFANELQKMRNFVAARRAVLLATLPPAPPAPAIRYAGGANFPTDQLVFKAAEIVDSLQVITSIEWRVAEVTDWQNPIYTTQQPPHYEITPIWESGELPTHTASIQLPYHLLRPAHTYRVRARFKNRAGYCSHWSEAVQFVAGMPSQTWENKLIISEILYHATPPQEVEFIELYNASDTAISLQYFQLTGGIQLAMTDAHSIPAKGYAVFTNHKKQFKQQYGFEPMGEYKGNLRNRGDVIMVRDAVGLMVDSVTFTNVWDVGSDGKGFSLELLDYSADNSLATYWRASLQPMGTPAAATTHQPIAKNANSVASETAQAWTPETLWNAIGWRWLQIANWYWYRQP